MLLSWLEIPGYSIVQRYDELAIDLLSNLQKGNVITMGINYLYTLCTLIDCNLDMKSLHIFEIYL